MLLRLINKNTFLRGQKERFKQTAVGTKLVRRRDFKRQKAERFHIALEVTTECNLRCGFCPHTIEKKENNTLTVSQFSTILDKLRVMSKSSGRRQVVLGFGGVGEPFTIADFAVFLQRSRQAFPTAELSTVSNFTCIKSNVLEQIIAERLLDELRCSMNYGDEHKYHEICGAPALPKVEETIDRFVTYKQKHDSPLVLGIEMKKPAGLTRSQMASFEASAHQRWGNAIEISWGDLINWGGRVDSSRFELDQRAPSFPCYSLFQLDFVIDYRGDVYPCCYCWAKPEVVAELRLGNVYRTSFRTMKRRFRTLRKIHMTGQWRRLAICRECTMYADDRFDLFFRLGKRYF